MSFEKKLGRMMPNGRAMFLAYDQGFEHGPRAFDANLVNEDPNNILDIGLEGGFTGIVFLRGNAERYYAGELTRRERKRLPLILKVNVASESELENADDYDSTLSFNSVLQAVIAARDFGASAVGYTYYLGSKYGKRMKQEFGALVQIAHQAGLPAIGWIYPRSFRWLGLKRELEAIAGRHHSKEDIERFLRDIGRVKGSLGLRSETVARAASESILRGCPIDETPTIIATAARAGAELGADIVKIKYSGDVESFRWVVRCAGMTEVVMSGGPKSGKFLDQVEEVIDAGGIGVAVGRNVWQSERQLEVAKALREIIFKDGAK